MKRPPQATVSELVVGLDSSTTGTKAIAFNRNGNIVARASHPIPLSSPQPNYFEQDPDDWWHSTCSVLKEITARVPPDRIVALAISNQRETFVPLGTSGEPLRPAIIWLDERCKGEVEKFSRRIGKAKIHRITGKPPDYAPVVYRLAWMKHHEASLFRKIRMVCDVHAYLVWKLTGSHTTSWASADPLGLFDLKQRKWSPAILGALGLSSEKLPRAVQPGSIIGEVTAVASKSTGLKFGTAIIAGGGDGQVAGLGANALNPARAYLNLGTAVVAGVYGNSYRISTAFRTMSSCSDRGYYYECSLRAGTFAIDWLIRNLLKIDPQKKPQIYKELEQEGLRIPAGSDGVLHLPYLCGVMNPYWDMDAKGAFVGLSSSHHRGHLYRSILEGIAFEQRRAIEAVEKSVGRQVRELVAIGGGAMNRLWCQILADITGKTICVPVLAEASALGAAMTAAVGAGWFTTFQQAASAMAGKERRIMPNKTNRHFYHTLYERYTLIYPLP